jgi:hypothetical protein
MLVSTRLNLLPFGITTSFAVLSHALGTSPTKASSGEMASGSTISLQSVKAVPTGGAGLVYIRPMLALRS